MSPVKRFCVFEHSSWQISTAHAQPFRGAMDLAFCLKVPLDSLLVWASSEWSGETARMRSLAWTFAARIGDKYQIRLTRSTLQCTCTCICLIKWRNAKRPTGWTRRGDHWTDEQPGAHTRRTVAGSFLTSSNTLSVKDGHEIFSTVSLSLPLIQEGQLSVTGEIMCTKYW